MQHSMQITGGSTPLHCAEDAEMVALLLDRGADVHAQDQVMCKHWFRLRKTGHAWGVVLGIKRLDIGRVRVVLDIEGSCDHKLYKC